MLLPESAEFSLGDGAVVFDLEIAEPVTDPSGWATPWNYPLSVGCTLSDADGFRDWIGDESAAPLLRYLQAHDRVIGFNSIRFDYGVLDGCLLRGFDRGGAHANRVRKVVAPHYDLGETDPVPGMVKTILRTKTVDLLVDVTDHLAKLKYPRRGRHTGLDAISSAMIGAGKESSRFSGGAEAPQAWKDRLALEVIAYCRIDVLRTAEIYHAFVNGAPLKVSGWPEKGINEFEGQVAVKLR